MNLGRYGKMITALVTGLIGWGVQVVHSAPTSITAGEWIQFVTVLAIGLGVYSIANEPV